MILAHYTPPACLPNARGPTFEIRLFEILTCACTMYCRFCNFQMSASLSLTAEERITLDHTAMESKDMAKLQVCSSPKTHGLRQLIYNVQNTEKSCSNRKTLVMAKV